MAIKQLRIKTPNVWGKLSNLSDALGQHGVNIRAISVRQESNETASLCIIADDPKKAEHALKADNISFSVSDVLAVEMPDHPGGMNAVLRPLKDAHINVIAMYPYIGRATNPIMIIEIDKIEDARETLNRNWVKIWNEDVYRL
ncbi:MAG: hypothetical protein U9P80_05855 [Thermodesulfobacteriota bacterium]|nr:hypothetical protein [Thermodesulfobacteriota bacterium]